MAKQKDNKPYSLGYNGHAKSCDCEQCGKSRAQHLSELWEANGSYATPKTADSTIFVRSYFRRQSNHLKKYPVTRRIMQSLIKTIRAQKS